MVLRDLGRVAEAADDGRRALALAREIGYPAGELRALVALSLAAERAGDLGSAVQLARQAAQITQGIPGSMARLCSWLLACVLEEAGDLAAAEEICAAGLAQSRDAGDLGNQQFLLTLMVGLDLRAGRTGDAAAHLQEGLQIGMRTGLWYELSNGLDCCGELCAATGRFSEAITVWAATDALWRHAGFTLYGADARRRDEELRKARQALGPAPARAAQERGAAMSLATAAEFALLLTAPGPQQTCGALGPGKPQRPGTGTGHPGRPRPHRRADRRTAVHQRPHRPLPPGPDPRQDRLPPPRRPHPPGPDRGPDLAAAHPQPSPARPPWAFLPRSCWRPEGAIRPLPGVITGQATCD